MSNLIIFFFTIFVSLFSIANSSCSSNCLTCSENEPDFCLSCPEGQILVNNVCYFTKCTLSFKHCDYCSQSECIKCFSGYSLNKNKCKLDGRVSGYIASVVILMIVILVIIGTMITIKKRRAMRLQMLKQQQNQIMQTTPMGMQSVQMVNMSNNQNAQDVPVTSNMMAIPVDNSKTDYNQFGNTSVMGNTNAGASQLIDNSVSVNGIHSNALIPETPSDSQRKLQEASSSDRENKVQCVFCNSENVFMKSSCSCYLCYNHCNAIKRYVLGISGDEVKCPKHNSSISDVKEIKEENILNVLIETIPKSLKKDGICEICRKIEGTLSFNNCSCEAKICSQCYEDNMTLYQYRQCPFCMKKID